MNIFTPTTSVKEKTMLRRFTNVCLLIALFCLGINSAKAQYTTPTVNGAIAANEYGTHTDGNNQNTNSSVVTYMTWDATNLYVGVSGSNVNEAIVLYLDKDPQNPVNGGANSNGTNVGFSTYDGTNFALLPFRADVVLYAKNGYREYRTADGANGWSAATTAWGSYSDNGLATSSGVQEFAFPWSAIGGIPSSFNFFSYKAYTNGIYNQQPTANPTGAIGTTARNERYFTVSTTANGSATKPFSRESVFINQTATSTFSGTGTFFDFTVNQSLTVNIGSSFTVTGQLFVGSGSTLTMPASGGARTITFGSTSTNTPSLVCNGTLTPNNGAGNDLNLTAAFGTTTISGSAANTAYRIFNLTVNNGATVQAPSSGTVDLGWQFGTLTVNTGGTLNFVNGSGVVNLTNSGTTSTCQLANSGTMIFNNLTNNTGNTLRPATSPATSAITVAGSLVNNGTFSTSNTGLLDVTMTGAGGTTLAAGTYQNLTISNTGSTSANTTGVTASGAIVMATGKVFTISSGARLDMGTNLFTITGATSSINGFFRTANTSNPPITGASTTTLTVNNGGWIELNQSCAGVTAATNCVVPPATWNTGSTAAIIGLTSPTAGTFPGGMTTQTLQNIVWNCTSQSTAPNLGGATITCSGTFTLASTGTSELRLGSASSGTITCAGFAQTGGTLNFAAGAGAGTLNCSGTFNQSGGTLTESSTGSGKIVLNAASGNQNVTVSGTVSNDISWEVGTGASTNTATMLSNIALGTAATSMTVKTGSTLAFGTFQLTGTGAFTAQTGSGLSSANTAASGAFQTSGAGGSVVVSGTKTFTNAGVSYTFNGSSGQFTGDAVGSAVNTNITNLTINNTAGVTVTHPIVMSATGALTFTNGSLTLGANDLTLTSGATVSGAGAGKYVKTNGAGQLKRTALTTAFTFPVGNSAYNPITLTNTGTSDTYGILVVDGTVANALDATKAVNRAWAVTEGTSGGGNLAVTAQFNTADGAGASYSTASNQFIGLYPNASPWTQYGSGAAASGSNPYTVSVSGFTNSLPTSGTTNYFAVGNTGAFVTPPTPPTITSISASVNNGANTGYVGSTITVNGTNFLASGMTVKVGGSGGTTISSYIFVNSTQITFTAINLSGDIYIDNGTAPAATFSTYTNLGYITTQTGTWQTAATWLGGAVPPSATTTAVTIAHNVTGTTGTIDVGTLTINATNTLTVTSGSTLNLNNTATNNGTLSVAGTLQMNQGSSVTGTAVSYSSGSLTYNHTSGTFNVSLEWPGTNSPTNVTVNNNGGTGITFVTNSITSRTVAGTLTLNSNLNEGSATLTVLNFVGNATAAISGTGGYTQSASGSFTTAHASGVNGNITVSGSVTIPTSTSFTFNGSVQQVTGTLMPATVNNFTSNNTFSSITSAPTTDAGLTFSQSTTITGTLTITGAAPVGMVAIGASNVLTLSGAVVSSSNKMVSVSTADFVVNGSGAFTGNGLFASGSTFNNFTINRTGTTVFGGASLTVGNNFNLTDGLLNQSGGLTLNGPIAFGVNGQLRHTGGGLTIGGSGTITGTLKTSVSPLTVTTLTMNRTGQTLTLGTNVSVSGGSGVILSGGIIDIGNFTLTTTSTSALTTTPTNGGMVKATGTGTFIRTIPTGASTINFPIGDGTNYTPAQLAFSANAISGTIGCRVTASAHPNLSTNYTQLNYLNRYWSFTTATVTTYTYQGTFTYVPGDVVGTETSIKANRWTGSAWSEIAGSTAGSNTLTTASGLTETTAPLASTSEYTGRVNTIPAPTITSFSASVNNGANTGYVGSTVTVNGTYFLSSGMTVKVGGSAGTTVSYTFVNSTQITFTAINAGGTIYIDNGGGNVTSSSSYTNLGYITNANNTTWQTNAAWLNGTVPPANSDVTINNSNVQVFTGGSFTANNVIINSGAELRFTGGSLTATNITNNGLCNINNTTGTITTTTFTNNSGGTLQWTAANTLNIAAGGTLTNNGTFTRGTGTLNFAGAGTINGTTAITLNNLTINTGGLTLSTVPTIDGTFNINGGNLNQAPVYSSNSTLQYNAGYTRYLEWSATGVGTIGTTPGYPNNVTIAGSSTFNLVNGDAATARACNGLLTVLSGSTFNCNNLSAGFTMGSALIQGNLNMNTMSGTATVTGTATITGGTWNMGSMTGAANIGGNLTINSGTLNMSTMNQPITVTGNVTVNGTLTMSSSVGGDLKLGGNWSGIGTFTANSRLVEFNGSAAAQTITGATTFDYLKINNTFSTPTVTLNNNITVNNQLDLTAGKLVLGTNNCTITSGGSIVNPTANNYVNTNSTGRLIQTVAGSDVFYPVGRSVYNPITLNNSGGTSDSYGVYVLDATTSPAANDNTKVVNRYWNVNEGTANGSNLTVTTQWNSPGEENANFASGITPKIGVYAGAGPWVTQNTGSITTGTVTGSNKVTSSATFTADISAGGTFAIGKDNAFLGVPPTVSSFTPTSQYSGGTVVISGSGFTGTTAVTFGGTGCTFTVDNDGQITATIIGGTTGSVVVTNPSGSSTLTGFTFLGYITQTGATTWGTAASWLGNVVPPAGAVTTIDHNISLSTTILTNPATITINSGKTFTIANSGVMTVNTSITNGGTMDFSGTGSLTVPAVTNNGTLSWTGAGTLNIAAGGTITNNATFTGGVGTVNFAGAGTVNGSSAVTFNNLTINTGALNLGTGTAVDGTLRINGGNIDPAGAMPIYTSNSTLFYNATYGRFKEWDAVGIGTIGTTPGYPNNVTVNTGTLTVGNSSTLARAMNGLLTVNNAATVSIDANISTLTIGNGITINSGGTINHQTNTGAVNITGNVTVAGGWLLNSTTGTTTVTGNVTNSGGTINMGSATGSLNVTGNFANTSGTFSMSSVGGGDLYVGGNLSNSGTFTHNSRAVFFNGTTQNITGTFNNTGGASNTFAFVRINNGTNVTLGTPVSINSNLTFNSGKITLGTNNLVLSSGATITGASASNYVVTNNTGQLRQVVTTSAITFPVGNSAYNPIILTNTGTSDTYGVNVLDGALPVANDVTYSVNRRWQVTEAVSGGSTLTATAQFNSGEENTNYNSGTVNYIGFYNGTAWSQVTATFAGTNPYTVAGGTFSPTNLTTGTQYFGVGRDAALAIPPPIVSSFTVSPNNGSTTSGYTGSTVTISGLYFYSVTGVTIGGVAATNVTTVNPTTITCNVPQSGASGSIVVTTAYGSGSLAGFTYLGYITQTGATDWATAASWLGGSVPPAAAATTIDHNLNILSAVANAPSSITINSGDVLDFSNAAGTITATTVTNNGTLSFSAAGTLTIAASGTLTNNNTFTGGAGTVNMAGASTINGTNAITFNNLTINTGTTTLTTVPTINGTLRINGGNVSAGPRYTANSTLQYNATYTRSNEWSAVGVGTIGTTQGYPNNVTVSTGTLTVLNADAGTARAINGNLQVNTGCTFTTGALNANVTVAGNATTSGTGTITLSSSSGLLVVTGNVTNAGSLTLSTVVGGDLYVGGNLANNGTFTHNDRSVYFTGTAQTVSGTFNATGTTNRFAFIRINNGTNVTLGTAINVKSNVTFNSGKITLSTFDMVMTSGATFTTPSATNYVVTNSTGQLKQVVTTSAISYPVGNSSYNPVTLTNSGTSDTYGINVVDAAPPTAIASKSINRYWSVTEAVAGGGNLTPVVLQYNTGEEGGSFNAGTTPYMGLYNGTGWYSVGTTLAGSNPFTATSTGTGQFPATIPAGSYLAIGKDDAFGNGFYRSITSGNWSSLSTWESSPDNATWSAATVVPGSGYGTGFVTIQNGHTVTVDYVTSPASVTINSGATLVGSDDTKQLYIGSAGTGPINISGTFTMDNTIVTITPAKWLYCGTMTIGSGGVFNNNSGNALALSIATINVQNGGTYNHNAVGSSANGSANDFAGTATTRTFGATSNCNITKWGQPGGVYTALPATTFGNLTINLNHSAGGSWQQSGTLTNIQGDFTVTNTGGATREFRLCTTQTFTLNIGGNLTINGGFLTLSSSTGVPTVNVTKGFIMSSGTYDGTGSGSLNFINGGTGDIDISGGTNTFGTTNIASGRLCNILNTSNINVGTGRVFTVSGYTNIEPGAVVSGSGSFAVANSALATLGIGSPNGITTIGTASGNVQTTTARTFNPLANYMYTGTANQVTGSALPTSVNTLSIANTGTSGNNVVTLSRAGTTTLSSAGNPSLILNSGLFRIPNGSNIDIASGGGIQNTGAGDFDATTPASSGIITFRGTGTTSGAINFYPGVIQTPSSPLGVTYGAGAVIRNYLRMDANSFIPAPPTYATGSTLIYNHGVAYQRNAEWSSGGAAVGTPHHVTIQNGTSLLFDNNNASSADRYMSGDLTLGVTGSAGSLDMGAMTKQIYVGGNVVIGGTTGTSTLTLSSVLTGDIHVKGNWTRNSFGAFVPNNRAVYFDSSAGNQTITASGGATYDFLIVDKAAGSVVLANDATINQLLTLSNGYITTNSNKVIIGSSGAVTRTNGWVAGNLQKSISASGAITFETGASDAYRPVNLNFSSVTTPGTLTALVSQTGGTYSPLTGSGFDAAGVLQRNYKLTNSSLAGTYDATFNFIAGDVPGGGNTATYRVRNTTNSGTTWADRTIGTRTSTSTQATGISTFGDFVIGNSTTMTITNPSNSTVCQGANATFTASASTAPTINATSITVQWQVSTDNGSTWNNVSGGGYTTNNTGTNPLNSTLTITAVTTGMNNYQYRAVFSDINGSNNSNAGTLTVTPTVGTPTFTLGATSTRCQGAGTVTYTASASNTTGITYSLDATSLAGGNSINSSTGEVTYVAGYSGTSVITASAAGCNGPATATHTVTITPTVGTPSFTLGATSTRCQGAGTVTYTASASNTTGITYSLDATSLAGGNSINSSTGEVTYVAGYTGTSVITASAAGCNGPVTATHTVTITPTVGTPTFTLGATSTRCQGAGTVTYTASASNTTGITYSLDATSLAGGNSINSSTGAVTYVAGYSGTSVITASAAGCNGPATATHTVTITPTVGTPSFTLGATSTRCQGAGTVTYTASASNTTGITYSLDATSLAGGNSINSSTGEVTYVAGYSGTSVITASAAGCNGPSTATHTVTITPTVGTPSFTLGATSTRCGGVATITYTASAANTTGITYSLDATSLAAGVTINSGTGAVTYTATYSGSSVITASAAGCNGPSTATHTVTVGSNTWSGTTSTDWSTSTNWSCGLVPLSGQDIIIPNTVNKPVLSSSVNIGALNLQSGTTLTIGSNTLVINGAVSGSGTISGSINSNIDMFGTGTLNFTTGANSLNNLTINSAGTVTLGTDVRIAGILTPTSGTFALGSNTVTLLAGTNGESVYGTRKTYPVTGIVGVVAGTIDYTGGGKFLAERYIPARRAFRFLTSPVNTTTELRTNWMEGTYNAGPGYGTNNNPNPGYGTHISGSAAPADKLDWTLTNNPSLFTYNNATQSWAAVYNSNGTLAAGYPYRLLVRGNRGFDLSQTNTTPTSTILRQTGTLVTGNVTLGSVSSSPATMPLLNGSAGGFSYVGNPYASPVNWNTIFNNSTNISPTLTIWDPNLSVRGAYAYNNTQTGITSPPASAVDDNIQPGQAFFVQASAANPSLVFNESYKTTTFTNVWRNTSTLPRLNITVATAANNASLDGAVVVFDNQFPATLGAEDSYKFTNLDENLSVMSNNKLLSIEGRPAPQVNDSVAIRITQYKQNNYALIVNGINFDPSLAAYVKDKYLNTETPVDLAGGSTIVPFDIVTTDASSAADRFVIVFKPAAVLPITITGVNAYQKNDGIQVDWTVQNEINTDRYEVEKSATGQRFDKAASVAAKNANVGSELYKWYDNNPVNGNNYYRIKAVGKSGEIKYTRIVKVSIGKGNSSITVYPNPVKNSLLNVQFANLQKGRYNVIIFNTLGEKVFTQTVEHNGVNANYSIKLNQIVAKGAYKMVISNTDFEQTESIIIE